MRKVEFSTGGFVLHKAYIGNSKRYFSAWFEADGALIDAEGFNHSAPEKSYPATEAQRIELQRLGRVWKGRLPHGTV